MNSHSTINNLIKAGFVRQHGRFLWTSIPGKHYSVALYSSMASILEYSKHVISGCIEDVNYYYLSFSNEHK